MVTINQNTQEKSERSNIKKKTVIFANSKESSGSNIAYVRSGSRKGTKYSNASKQSKITNKAKRHIHQKLTRFKGQEKEEDSHGLKTISIDTKRSVVSINVDEQSSGSFHAREKSLRSNESILKTEKKLKYKGALKRTRTAKIINTKELINLDKPFKSQRSLNNTHDKSIFSNKDKA